MSQLVHLLNNPTVTIGGVQASVQYAGMVVGNAGLYQVNLTIPPNTGLGDQPVVVTVAGRSTPSGSQMGPIFLNIASPQ